MDDRKSGNEKRVLGTFIFVLICAGAFGGLIGFMSVNVGVKTTDGVIVAINQILINSTPYLIPISSAILLILAFIIYKVSIKRYAQLDIEDDTGLVQIETGLTIALALNSICLIFDYFFFAISIQYANSIGVSLACLISFLLSVAIIVIMQKRIIDFEKKLNPDKTASTFDFRFAKKWEESCDEAEKLSIYKAAFASYKATNATCIALWLLTVLVNLFHDIGIMPVAIVSVIWFVQVTSYSLATIKRARR
jgi:hypothetical protein